MERTLEPMPWSNPSYWKGDGPIGFGSGLFCQTIFNQQRDDDKRWFQWIGKSSSDDWNCCQVNFQNYRLTETTLPNSTIITANTNLTCKTTSISVCPSDFFVQKTGSKSSKQKTTIRKCVHSFAFVLHFWVTWLAYQNKRNLQNLFHKSCFTKQWIPITCTSTFVIAQRLTC